MRITNVRVTKDGTEYIKGGKGRILDPDDMRRTHHLFIETCGKKLVQGDVYEIEFQREGSQKTEKILGRFASEGMELKFFGVAAEEKKNN